MIEIEQMRNDEIEELLGRLNYGHLACSNDDVPYVVPVHFAYDPPGVFIYTTEGKKAEMIRRNPRVCLQAEDVHDRRNWKSVIVNGDANQIMTEEERSRALELITKVNPTLTPAVSIRWMDSWVRENVEVILKINPESKTGRATVDRSDTSAPYAPPVEPDATIN